MMAGVLTTIKHLKKRILTSATDAVQIPAFIGLHNPEKLNFLMGARTMDTLWVVSIIAVIGITVGVIGYRLGFIKKPPAKMTKKGAAQGSAAGASTTIHGPGGGGS